MDSLKTVYYQQRKNVRLLKRKLRFPQEHGLNLPVFVDLRTWMTEIKDQGDMNSCVANAIVSSIEYLYKRYTGQYVQFSRLFIDYNARVVNSRQLQQALRGYNIETDDIWSAAGANREDGLNGVQKFGFCEESLWPYNEALFRTRPPDTVYQEAARRSIVPLRIPVNIVSLKTCLAQQIPVLIGILLSAIEDDNKHGWIKIPEKIPQDRGYHACLVLGYDDRSRHFIIRNTWGIQWGDQGHFYLPYQYLMIKPLVITDSAFWAIVQLIPREAMNRRGYYSYPNYTQYHLQNMITWTDKNAEQQKQQRGLSNHLNFIHYQQRYMMPLINKTFQQLYQKYQYQKRN